MEEQTFNVSVIETLKRNHTITATTVEEAIKYVKENSKEFITDDDDIISREFQVMDDNYEELSDKIELY
nr:hypothetical protein [uncultured Ruminococcus sp.]